MAQQVEVRLTDGGSETIEADSWFSTDRGGLDVLTTGDSTSGTIVATFAPGQWSFVKVVIEGQSEPEAEQWPTCASGALNTLFDKARMEQADDNGKSDSQVFVSVADIKAALRRLANLGPL